MNQTILKTHSNGSRDWFEDHIIELNSPISGYTRLYRRLVYVRCYVKRVVVAVSKKELELAYNAGKIITLAITSETKLKLEKEMHTPNSHLYPGAIYTIKCFAEMLGWTTSALIEALNTGEVSEWFSIIAN